jgi:hypothetical protein
MRNTYAVGANMPGYMPDSEPHHIHNYRTALACFRDNVIRAIEEDIEAQLLAGEIDGNTAAAREMEMRTQLKAVCASPRKRIDRAFRVGSYRYWMEQI